MLEGYGYADLSLFEATTGWGRLGDNERSLMTAYLRRSETWTIDAFLTNAGRPGGVTAASLRPRPPTPTPPTTIVSPPVVLQPVVSPPVDATPNPMNYHNAVPVIIPPTATELQRLHADWDKEWKRKEKEKGGGGSGSAKEEAVTLTSAERQRAVMLGRQWSATHSGHGRASHGSYASSSSPHTAELDRERSEEAAIEREIDNALQRKKNTGRAFNS